MYTNDQKKQNDAVKTILECDKGILGTKRKRNINHGRNFGHDKEEISKERKKLCVMILSSNCEDQIQVLKLQRNTTFKEIWKRVNVKREKETDEVFKGMERLQEESKMFKIIKMMNRKRLENPFYVRQRWKACVES